MYCISYLLVHYKFPPNVSNKYSTIFYSIHLPVSVDRVSGSSLAGGLWLRVFHEFAAKRQLGTVSSEGLTGAGGCISKVPLMPGCLCWLLAGGLRASPCRPLQSAVCVLMTGRLDFPGGVLQESYNDAMTQSPKSVSVLSPDA